MRKILVGTRNAGKIREIQNALADLPFIISGLPDTDIPEFEETGATFSENAILKAEYYAKYTGECCLADDSGLEVDALGGAPGVFSARYAGAGATDSENNAKLLEALQGVPLAQRTARFRCVLALVDQEGLLMSTDGVCEGLILTGERGTGGFGYDPMFYLPAQGKTLAEMTVEEKNRISHRGKALHSFKEKMLQEIWRD